MSARGVDETVAERAGGGLWLCLLALAAVTVAATPLLAAAENWVEVGADLEARFYVDADSISVDGENVRVVKRGVYNNTLTESLGGRPTVFRQTLGIVELDCRRRINRVIRIDMLDEKGEVVWSSGFMKQRMWEDVHPQTHAEATLRFACSKAGT